MEGSLSGLKVVEVSLGMAGSLAGMLLADQGADVVSLDVYPNDPYIDLAGERLWNRGKNRVQVSLVDSKDLNRIKNLCQFSDVVLLALDNDELEKLDLTYNNLVADNPQLIVANISSFGSISSMSNYPNIDGIVHALSGSLLHPQNGAMRLGPVYVAPKIASYSAAMLCVQGILSALRVRDISGFGQHVDASLLRGILCYRSFVIATNNSDKLPPLAQGGDPRGIRPLFNLCECNDGKWLSMAAFTRAFCEDALKVMDLEKILEDKRFVNMPNVFENDDDRYQLLNILWSKFKEKPRDEWIEKMWKANVPCEPVLSHEEFRYHEQFWSNDLAIKIDDPVVGDMIQPGLLGIFSETPGKITPTVLKANSSDSLDLLIDTWGQNNLSLPIDFPEDVNNHYSRGPLAGIKVLDFTSFVAGPMCSRLLSDLGADVMKVESFQGDNFHIPALFRAYAVLNRGKRSLVLDRKLQQSDSVFEKLVKESDIVVYNFRLGVEDRLKLDYETLKTINPKIIVCRITAFGPNGPQAYRPGYETSISALSGNYIEQAGVDNPPVQFGAADVSSGIAAATNILMALRARDVTGKGQHVDSTMIGAMSYVSGDNFVEFKGMKSRVEVDKEQKRKGPLDGLYQSSDGWIFLSIRDQKGWKEFIEAFGVKELLNSKFNFLNRMEINSIALSKLLEIEFLKFSTFHWETHLNIGNINCVNADVQIENFMNERQHFFNEDYMVEIPHPYFGILKEPGASIIFSNTPLNINKIEPGLGEHSDEILSEIGLSVSDIEKLVHDEITFKGSPQYSVWGEAR
jgi:crotonobetainyl-CoA:carnitine CoA-transferase CaiB-like acyl-CoA transferase